MSRLRRILPGESFPVPHFENILEYRNQLGFFDLRNGKMLSVCDGMVRLPFLNNEFSVPFEVLVAISTKGFKIPLASWDKLKVLYVEPSEEMDINNMVLAPVEPIAAQGLEGFFEIPGFSSYVISRSGELYSRNVGRLLRPYVDAMGYSMFGLNPDLGARTILGTHRLLALAFLPYPEGVDKMDVNHKDGVKSNNDLKNLEWVTRKGNCDHAYSSGLRIDNVPVLVRNAFSKEVLEFYSYAECSRHLNLNFESIRIRAQSEGSVLYFPGLQFKVKSCRNDWVDFEDPEKQFIESRLPKSYILTKLETGEETLASSAKEAGKIIGITGQYLPEKLSTTGEYIRNGYKLKYLSLESYAKSLFDEIRNR